MTACASKLMSWSPTSLVVSSTGKRKEALSPGARTERGRGPFFKDEKSGSTMSATSAKLVEPGAATPPCASPNGTVEAVTLMMGMVTSTLPSLVTVTSMLPVHPNRTPAGPVAVILT